MAEKNSFNWELLYKTIGKTVSTKRKSLGLPQQKLANKINLTRASLSNIERGRQKISLQNLYRLATALQLGISDLLPSNDEIINSNLDKEIKKHLQKQEIDWFNSEIWPEKEEAR